MAKCGPSKPKDGSKYLLYKQDKLTRKWSVTGTNYDAMAEDLAEMRAAWGGQNLSPESFALSSPLHAAAALMEKKAQSVK